MSWCSKDVLERQEIDEERRTKLLFVFLSQKSYSTEPFLHALTHTHTLLPSFPSGIARQETGRECVCVVVISYFCLARLCSSSSAFEKNSSPGIGCTCNKRRTSKYMNESIERRNKYLVRLLGQEALVRLGGCEKMKENERKGKERKRIEPESTMKKASGSSSRTLLKSIWTSRRLASLGMPSG